MANDSSIRNHERARERICLALDLEDDQEIVRRVDELSDLIGFFKLNFAFTRYGPSLVQRLLDRGCKVFLDLKLHDIPNTVGGYADAVTRLGVHIVTVHTSGGVEMMRQAVDTAERTAERLSIPRPKFIGVTLLTSISQQTLNEELNVSGSVEMEVRRKVALARAAGLDGIVCSPAELASIRRGQLLPPEFLFVTPGVRPAGGDPHDHKRVESCSAAIAAGSSLLVVGRTVLGAADSRAAARQILDEVAAALSGA
ncbi:MAG: orotidine-5'-phosphate decarboxylase [Acidobacteria bacterium]|nr:orotidine-5'-phosphate decarboxylase [Acidobacteriota bacterium]